MLRFQLYVHPSSLTRDLKMPCGMSIVESNFKCGNATSRSGAGFYCCKIHVT